MIKMCEVFSFTSFGTGNYDSVMDVVVGRNFRRSPD